MRKPLPLLLLCLIVVVISLSAARQAPQPVDASADAIRLNNLGVATMNQQKFEEALGYFEKAAAADASLRVATVNQAIALLALQRYEPAEDVLEKVIAADAANAHAWYNIGLMQKSLGDSEAALAAFQRTTELRPGDAHAHYFTGLIASQLQQYQEAVDSFTRAIEIDPFLISAEFGMARAYQRLGNPDESKVHMERFSRLTEQKIASALSLAYGDQGPLSMAQAVQPAGRPAVAPLAVTLDATDIGASLAVDGQPSGNADQPAWGACAFDANGDGRPDYLALSPTGGAVLFANRNEGFGRDGDAWTGTVGAVACSVGDLDNDELPDVVISRPEGVLVFRNQGEGAFANVTPDTGITASAAARPAGVLLVDYDHDTDLDLLIMAQSAADAPAGSRVWRNNGDGTFADVTGEKGLAGSGADIAAAASDLNNDRAVDLVVTSRSGATVLVNQREGAFASDELSFTAPQDAATRSTRGVVVFDFNKDGWMDLAFTHAEAPAVSVWKNAEGTAFEPVDLPAGRLREAWGLAPIDLDNDGWIDLAAAGTADEAGTLAIWRNTGGQFEDVAEATGAGRLPLKSPRALMAVDYDTDGDADLVVTQASGVPSIVRNEGGNSNSALRVALLGLNDNRSAIGTKVEVQAGTVWQKFEVTSTSGYLSASPLPVLAGIGAANQADVVRLLWPSGVVQDEVEIGASQVAAITQIDRRGSSCPVLFSWNGERYEFIADAIGPAVVGHWVAPATHNIPDPDEYVKVEGRQVAIKDGRLSFRFAEPMEEVIYLDQVKLIAVDHPGEAEVYPNEYFAALPPHPAAKTIVSRGARLPAGAWDDQGRDVMAALRERDRSFVDTFDSGNFKGFAKLHALELDLGPLPDGAPVRLLMHGFTDYFTATSVFAAHQADVTAIVPYVEAQLADGTWKKVIDDIGFPAGLLRTMTADLTGKLPAGTRRIRIWTNLKVYWDQVLVDTTPDGAVPVRSTEIPLAEASLAYRGFPREITGSPAADLQYVHDEVSPFGPYARHQGFYTRYGEVTSLLSGSEDQFVIFGAGDEVSLEFDAAALPDLPDGWSRDYYVYFRGFVKDMDFYAAHGQTVAPLPFTGMPGYPYPDSVSYPDRNRGYQLDWNTREVLREAWPTYRFEYGMTTDD